MPDGLDEIFAEVSAEAGGSSGEVTDSVVSPNANIWTGDDDVSDETFGSDDTDAVSDGEISDAGSTPDDGTSDDVFDYSAYGDKLVDVVVNGETLRVPLKEAIGGFMRQSDYTRKTQQLSEDRKLAEWGREMQHAFQVDPVGTLQALNEAFGYRQVSPQGEADVDPELLPILQQTEAQAAELRRVQAQLARYEQDRVLAEVRQELADVRGTYGDFDASVVLGIAAERGLSIEDAYLLHKSREMITKERSSKVDQERAAKLAAAEAAKRDQAQRIAARQQVAVDDGDGVIPEFDDFASLFEHNLKKSKNRV